MPDNKYIDMAEFLILNNPDLFGEHD